MKRTESIRTRNIDSSSNHSHHIPIPRQSNPTESFTSYHLPPLQPLSRSFSTSNYPSSYIFVNSSQDNITETKYNTTQTSSIRDVTSPAHVQSRILNHKPTQLIQDTFEANEKNKESSSRLTKHRHLSAKRSSHNRHHSSSHRKSNDEDNEGTFSNHPQSASRPAKSRDNHNSSYYSFKSRDEIKNEIDQLKEMMLKLFSVVTSAQSSNIHQPLTDNLISSKGDVIAEQTFENDVDSWTHASLDNPFSDILQPTPNRHFSELPSQTSFARWPISTPASTSRAQTNISTSIIIGTDSLNDTLPRSQNVTEVLDITSNPFDSHSEREEVHLTEAEHNHHSGNNRRRKSVHTSKERSDTKTIKQSKKERKRRKEDYKDKGTHSKVDIESIDVKRKESGEIIRDAYLQHLAEKKAKEELARLKAEKLEKEERKDSAAMIENMYLQHLEEKKAKEELDKLKAEKEEKEKEKQESALLIESMYLQHLEEKKAKEELARLKAERDANQQIKGREEE